METEIWKNRFDVILAALIVVCLLPFMPLLERFVFGVKSQQSRQL